VADQQSWARNSPKESLQPRRRVRPPTARELDPAQAMWRPRCGRVTMSFRRGSVADTALALPCPSCNLARAKRRRWVTSWSPSRHRLLNRRRAPSSRRAATATTGPAVGPGSSQFNCRQLPQRSRGKGGCAESPAELFKNYQARIPFSERQFMGKCSAVPPRPRPCSEPQPSALRHTLTSPLPGQNTICWQVS
jgi:hypothetical protein